jgi:hypothetical protein
LVLLQRRRKSQANKLGFRFTLTTWYEKRGKKVFYRSFVTGVRKPRRIERKLKRKKKKVKEAFTDLMLCATS